MLKKRHRITAIIISLCFIYQDIILADDSFFKKTPVYSSLASTSKAKELGNALLHACAGARKKIAGKEYKLSQTKAQLLESYILNPSLQKTSRTTKIRHVQYSLVQYSKNDSIGTLLRDFGGAYTHIFKDPSTQRYLIYILVQQDLPDADIALKFEELKIDVTYDISEKPNLLDTLKPSPTDKDRIVHIYAWAKLIIIMISSGRWNSAGDSVFIASELREMSIIELFRLIFEDRALHYVLNEDLFSEDLEKIMKFEKSFWTLAVKEFIYRILVIPVVIRFILSHFQKSSHTSAITAVPDTPPSLPIQQPKPTIPPHGRVIRSGSGLKPEKPQPVSQRTPVGPQYPTINRYPPLPEFSPPTEPGTPVSSKLSTLDDPGFREPAPLVVQVSDATPTEPPDPTHLDRGATRALPVDNNPTLDESTIGNAPPDTDALPRPALAEPTVIVPRGTSLPDSSFVDPAEPTEGFPLSTNSDLLGPEPTTVSAESPVYARPAMGAGTINVQSIDLAPIIRKHIADLERSNEAQKSVLLLKKLLIAGLSNDPSFLSLSTPVTKGHLERGTFTYQDIQRLLSLAVSQGIISEEEYGLYSSTISAVITIESRKLHKAIAASV